MNTTKFDNLVLAAENQLSPEPVLNQQDQPGSTSAQHTNAAIAGQSGVTLEVATQPRPAQAENGHDAQAATGAKQQKKKAPKRKRDDSQPKRPRGRPRKYPLPLGCLSNGKASQPMAQQAAKAPAAPSAMTAPLPGVSSGAPAAGLPLLNGLFTASSAAEQNGGSQPGRSLLEAFMRTHGTGVVGSPSKQSALYALHHQQQQAQQQAQLQQQLLQTQQQQPEQLQEYQYDPNMVFQNGFMAALMAGLAQTQHGQAGTFQNGDAPASLTQPALAEFQQAAAALLGHVPPMISNPHGALPAFPQDGSLIQELPPPAAVVHNTRSPSRRKPQKTPAKAPPQAQLAAPASPARMQAALDQSVPVGSPARAAASPTGRSRAQRKNAVTPQRVAPAAAVPVSVQPASPAAAASQQAAEAAPAAAEGVARPAGEAGGSAQQDAAEQLPSEAGVGGAADLVQPAPVQLPLEEEPEPPGEEQAAGALQFPGGPQGSKRPKKAKATKTKLMVELANDEPQQPEQTMNSVPAYHISQSRFRASNTAGLSKEAPGEVHQQDASATAAPPAAAQPQVTGPTEISEAATVSDHGQPDLGRGMLAALRSSPRRGDKAHARNNARTMSDKQAQSEAAGSPVTRSSAAARAVQSEPKAGPQHARSTASDWAQAASQARASLAKKQAGAMPDLAPPSAAAPAAAPVRAEAVEPPVQPSNVQAFVAASSAGPVGAEALLQAGAAAPAAVAAPAPAAAAPQPPEVPAVPAEAQAQPAVDATSIPATVPEAEPDAKRPLAAGQSAPAETANGSKPAAGGVLEAERADPQLAAAAAGVLPAGRDAAPQPQQKGVPNERVAPDQAASAPETYYSLSPTVNSQQTSAAAGAVKEELNKLLLEKLAEEAKRAHAAQEAIEVCRAAEEGLEHLKKQYELQQGFASSYQEVVNEVSEALQATSAANRHVSKVQEVQERLNAVQEELKLEVAAAELARSHAMTVLRRQQQLKEEMDLARKEVSRILYQPQTDLEQLHETVNAQREHVIHMRAAKSEAAECLMRCRKDKDELLRLMILDAPPTAEALAAARLSSAGQ